MPVEPTDSPVDDRRETSPDARPEQPLPTGSDDGSPVTGADGDAPVADPGFDLEEFLASTEVEVMAPRYKVSGKAPLAWTLENCWSIIILVALQIGWYYYGDNVMAFWNWVAAVATGWLALTSLIIAPTWRYLVARWDFSETAVYSRTGWWTHHYRIAPISRLQTVYTKRNLFERMLGLGTVIASTASAHGSVEISGLLYRDAEKLSEHLLKIAELDEGDAT